MIYCECGWPEPSGMCPSCNRMKNPYQPNHEEPEALTDLRTIGRFMSRSDQAAEAHFEHQINTEEQRYK